MTVLVFVMGVGIGLLMYWLMVRFPSPVTAIEGVRELKAAFLELRQDIQKMSAALDALKAADAAETLELKHVEAVLVDLKTKLDAAIASGNDAEVQAVADDLNAHITALQAAETAADPSV